MIGKINLNDNTANHPNTLRELGYEVEQSKDGDKDIILIECEAFLPQGRDAEVIDLSSLDAARETIEDVVANKQLIGYNTRAKLSDGTKRFGSQLCRILQQSDALKDALGFDPSALIAIKPKAKKPPKDFFA